VNLDDTDEQRALREALRDFFAKESPLGVVRAAEPGGFDASLWRKVTELGLPSIAVPARLGGGGAGLQELAIAAELVGRHLAPVPLIEAAAAGSVLAAVGSAGPCAGLASGALAGEVLATLALRPADDGGTARLVPAGAVADLVIVPRGDELVLVEQAGKPAAAVPNLGAMPIADVAVPAGAAVLARGAAGMAAYRRAVSCWELLTAAALGGLAAAALELAVGYVTQRRAFGVLIGSFQTVAHRLADSATAIDGARLLACEAAWAADSGEVGAGGLASMALLFAADTAARAAADCLHVHGGYGYTLEYDIQLYFRRATAWPLVAGGVRAGFADLGRRLYGAQE
jgi:alkylation response protein AidB-like acyl-CoA dehydrogenase